MINFHPDSNFWDLNPELRFVESFTKIYDTDKSKGKNDSSRIMNAIYLLLHKESRYRELPEKDKKVLIAKDYLKEKDFKWDDYKEQQVGFLNFTSSKARKLLRNWELKLEERDEFIGSLKYNENTSALLDKMMSQTKNIWEQYLSILNEVEKEEGSGNIKGGGQESLSEQGRI